VWRTDTGERVATLRAPDGGHTPVQFSPDGSLLAVANRHEVVLWRVGAWSREVVLRGNQGVGSMAFGPDSRTLAACGSVRGVTLWDAETGGSVAVLGERSGLNRDPVFSPDGRTLATVGEDNSVRLWHVPTRRELFTLYRNDVRVEWVRFEPPHRLLVGAHASGSEADVYTFPPP
jgi:WD40 repeat protein